MSRYRRDRRAMRRLYRRGYLWGPWYGNLWWPGYAYLWGPRYGRYYWY